MLGKFFSVNSCPNVLQWTLASLNRGIPNCQVETISVFGVLHNWFLFTLSQNQKRDANAPFFIHRPLNGPFTTNPWFHRMKKLHIIESSFIQIREKTAWEFLAVRASVLKFIHFAIRFRFWGDFILEIFRSDFANFDESKSIFLCTDLGTDWWRSDRLRPETDSTEKFFALNEICYIIFTVFEFSTLILSAETTTFITLYENKANAHVPIGAWVVCAYCTTRVW